MCSSILRSTVQHIFHTLDLLPRKKHRVAHLLPPLVGGVDFTHFHLFFLILLFNRVKAFGDVKRSFRRHRSRFLFFRHNLESVVLDAILRYEDRIRL